jgi:hypothetical protein
MRMEGRNVLTLCALFLAGTRIATAQLESPQIDPSPGGGNVKVTVDLNWAILQKGAVRGSDAAGASGAKSDAGLTLEMSAGRVVEAVPWPPEIPEDPSRRTRGPGPSGSWRLGRHPQGRVRARVEAPLDARLIVRGGDQVVSVPLAAIFERPQRTPAPAPLTVVVERLPWDSLALELGPPGSEGIVAPGAEIPVSIAFNILWPDASDVSVRATAVLRSPGGGDALRLHELSELMPANRSEPPVRTWGLRAPQKEGTYILEVRANWEPDVRDGSRLSRLIRRRKPAAVINSAVRRVALVVLDPNAKAAATLDSVAASERLRAETEADAVDLTRSRSYRPLASGRSPLRDGGGTAWRVPAEALIEPSRRDRLRGWIFRSGAEAAKIEPADATGLAWSAVGLKIAHPDRPHRLTLKVKGGEPAALGVGLIEPGEEKASGQARVLLDACACGPPILQEGPPLVFSWLVWPRSTEAVLVLVNRDPSASVRLGTVTLTELDDVPPAPVVHEPDPTAKRTLGLYLVGPHALDRFGDEPGGGDPFRIAVNLSKYLAYCGATTAIVREDLMERFRRRALDSQAAEDCTGPDRLEVLRRVLDRHGCSLWMELLFDGRDALPGLPPADSAEAIRRGLVRVDAQGHASGSVYHPLHPEVREAMKRRITDAIGASLGGRADGWSARISPGLVIRMGPGPTLLGTPDTGVDDATFERFLHETFTPQTAQGIPGAGTSDPDRFATRSQYLAGVGRMPWLKWRSRAMADLYAELCSAAQAAAPGSVLAVVTPVLDSGPAGDEARRVDQAGLAPSQAWRSVGLDRESWARDAGAVLLLRGVSLSTDPLAQDLATNPDLDAIVASGARRGLLLAVDDSAGATAPIPAPPSYLDGSLVVTSPGAGSGSPAEGVVRSGAMPAKAVWLSALPMGDATAADFPLGHALGALDAQWVFLAASAIAGHEDRLRAFASVLRSLPAWPARVAASEAEPRSAPFGTAVRAMGDRAQTFLEIANDSPYPIRLACLLDAPSNALIEDLGRGVTLAPLTERGDRNLVLDLLPFGVSAIRVAAPGARVVSVTPYSSEAVHTAMSAQFRALSAQLARLNRGRSSAPSEPANPGFEPDTGVGRDSSSDLPNEALPQRADHGAKKAGTGTFASEAPRGWRLGGQTTDGGAISLDLENVHGGLSCLRLTAATVPVSVVSDPFVPNAQSGLTIEAYFRSAPSDGAVRVWIEGQSGNEPYIRRSELTVSTSWDRRAVRASDFPAAGLDSARLRFEMMTPGVLWIDDVRIKSDAASPSERQNAQGALLAALQAYREERYSDFARLARSHWVRQAVGSGAAGLSLVPDLQAKAASSPPRPGDAAASALPPDRKLR